MPPRPISRFRRYGPNVVPTRESCASLTPPTLSRSRRQNGRLGVLAPRVPGEFRCQPENFAHQVCRSSMLPSLNTSLRVSLAVLLHTTLAWFLYVAQAIWPAVSFGVRS